MSSRFSLPTDKRMPRLHRSWRGRGEAVQEKKGDIKLKTFLFQYSKKFSSSAVKICFLLDTQHEYVMCASCPNSANCPPHFSEIFAIFIPLKVKPLLQCKMWVCFKGESDLRLYIATGVHIDDSPHCDMIVHIVNKIVCPKQPTWCSNNTQFPLWLKTIG